MKKFLRVFLQLYWIWTTIVLLYCLLYKDNGASSAGTFGAEIAKTSDGNGEKEVNVDGLWIVNSNRNSLTWPDPELTNRGPSKPGISASRQPLPTRKQLERVKILSSDPTALFTTAKVRDNSSIIAVLMLACNRAKTVRMSLDKLLKYRVSPDRFPIMVSLSCNHEATASALSSYNSSITVIQHRNQSKIQLNYAERYHEKYYYIARHYHWALNQTFFKFNFESAIVLEDDIEVASDFFEYFSGTLPVLRSDPTLWCVSAWNDNGKAFLVDRSEADLLHRTDFFPGLAWMLTRGTWSELERKWPRAFWEDWMREPAQRRRRACIRPELPRARAFHPRDLKLIRLSDAFIPFSQRDLSYLLKDNYDMEFVRRAYKGPVLDYRSLVYGPVKSGRIRYYSRNEFVRIAKALGLVKDFRSGVPRTAYRGIVTFLFKGHRIYLTPHKWESYDISWI